LWIEKEEEFCLLRKILGYDESLCCFKGKIAAGAGT
jgi:hypothetical protein